MGLMDIFSKKKVAKWDNFLKGVDYIEAREAIRCMFDMMADKEKTTGEGYAIKKTNLDALDPFMKNPCFDTALKFLNETDGAFAQIFDNSKHIKLFSSDPFGKK